MEEVSLFHATLTSSPEASTVIHCQGGNTSLDGLEIDMSTSSFVVSSFIFTGTSVCRE